MKQSKISRRSFLLGLGAVSAAAVLTACGGSSSASTAASGSAASGSSVVYRTLDQIKESGTINIGVFSDKNPFGYVDENGEYQGYDVYFANRLGEDLGVKVNFVSTEAANRIEYLQTGKVDLILANFTVTDERKEEVDFALPYMSVSLGVVSPKSNTITSLDNWNESDSMIVEQVGRINALPLTTVKFHQLQVFAGTAMAAEYDRDPSQFRFWEVDEYIDLFIEILRRLRPDIVVERFASEAPPRYHYGRNWGLIRNQTRWAMLEKRLCETNAHQGEKFVNL